MRKRRSKGAMVGKAKLAGLILARSGSPSFVAVVQSANEGQRYDGSHFGRVNRSWLRCVLPQRKMRSRSVIVIEIGSESSSQRGFMEHDHMVEAFATNGANHPLDIGRCQGER
jgi:hypothetical protein